MSDSGRSVWFAGRQVTSVPTVLCSTSLLLFFNVWLRVTAMSTAGCL